jgi:O-antigen/teichoic acid export membrane protein/DNA-binding transcriptional MerR regulator
MQEDDELLTRREAADRAGVTSGTIRLWERAGRLHAIPTGDRRLGPLFSAKEIEQAMRRSAVLRAASSMEAISHNAVEVQPSDDAPGLVAARAATGVFGPDAETVAELEASTVESEIDVERETAGAAEAALAGRRGRGRPPAVLIRERLLRGSGWVLLGTAGATILGTVATGLIAHVLGKNSFGVYSLGFSIATIGGTLSQLGMERAVVRLVAAALGTDLPGRARKTLRLVFTSALVGSAFLALLLVFGLGDFLATTLFHSQQLAQVMQFVAIWVIAAAFQSLLAESFRSFQRFWLATLFNGLMFDVVAVLVFGWLFIQHRHITVAHAILLTVGAITVSSVIAAVLLAKRYASLHGPGDIRFRELFDVAWPLLGFNMATFLVGTGVDLWVVGSLASKGDVALYAAASKLVFYVGTAFIIASQVVPPIIAELWAQGKRQQLERALREVATLAGLPALIVLGVFVFAGEWVMGVVYGPAFREGATVLAILSSARLVAVITGNSGVALQMTGYQRTMFYLTIFTGVCSLTAEIVFGNLYGLNGVAWSTAAAQIMQNLLQLGFAKRKLGIWTQAELSLRPFIALARRAA